MRDGFRSPLRVPSRLQSMRVTGTFRQLLTRGLLEGTSSLASPHAQIMLKAQLVPINPSHSQTEAQLT